MNMISMGQGPVQGGNKTEEGEKGYEARVLPVKDEGRCFDMDYVPKVEGEVTKASVNETIKYRFVLPTGGVHYILRLDGDSSSEYRNFSFKTKEHGYAFTELDGASTQELFERMADLCESAYQDSGERIRTISMLPVDDKYTVEDVEKCINAILSKTDKYNEDVLRREFLGGKIFKLYSIITKEDFLDGKRSGAEIRSRYLKMKFSRYFKNWKVEEIHKGSTYFSLKRK